MRNERVKKTRVEIYNPPQKARRIPAPDDRAVSRPRTEDERERATPLPIMATCEERVNAWMEVDKQELWVRVTPASAPECGFALFLLRNHYCGVTRHTQA